MIRGYDQSLIFGRKTRYYALPPTTFELFPIFPSCLRSSVRQLVYKLRFVQNSIPASNRPEIPAGCSTSIVELKQMLSHGVTLMNFMCLFCWVLTCSCQVGGHRKIIIFKQFWRDVHADLNLFWCRSLQFPHCIKNFI